MSWPDAVIPPGSAIESQGFIGDIYGYSGLITSGLGIVTFGFLWGCADIWWQAEDTITTTWVGVTMGQGDSGC